MRFIPLFFMMMFIVFAALQLNDPDPVRWIFAYLAAAFLCYLGSNGRLNRPLAFTSKVLFAAAAVYQFPPSYHGLTGNMDLDPNIELARESFGLLICSAAVLTCYFISQKIRKVEAK